MESILQENNNFIKDYIVESREYLNSLDEFCLNAEKSEGDEEFLKELLRILHSLKGTSRMMGFSNIEQIIHETETVFKNIQNNHSRANRNDINLLISVISVIRKAVDTIEQNQTDQIANFDFILENVKKAANDEDYTTNFFPRENQDSPSEENLTFHDSDTIKINISQINSILQYFDKLIMRQIKLKKEIEQLKEQSEISNLNFREVTESIDVIEKQTFDIQEKIISLRMLPFDMILMPLKHSIAEESLKLNKNVEFEIPHSEITIDKSILEKLPKILIHLVRNAIDHGIETPQERKKAKKSKNGKVSISVTQNSNRILVTVSDDGRGIDFAKIQKKAISKYPERANEISKMQQNDLLQFLFESGFSTKDTISELSGRGVGLDVVRTETERLKGKISISTESGKGTSFELSLPSSLATQDGLFIRQSKNIFLILSHYIKEIITVPKTAFLKMQKGLVLNLHKELIPVYDFDEIIGKLSGTPSESKSEVPVIVIEYLNKKIAVMADEILYYKTVVIKPLPHLMKKVQGLQGVVFDENYKIIPVLNIPNCIRRFKSVSIYSEKNFQVQKAPKIYSALVVDDSHTTRNIEKIILESENYAVDTACDGIEALEKLKTRHFDLVITDIKMPRMDGFVLLHNMRHSEEFKNIPVIVISSVFENDTEEKVRKMGAQGYIVKSDFERENLIQKAREILNG